MALLQLIIAVFAIAGATHAAKAEVFKADHFQAEISCDSVSHRFSIHFSGDPAAVAARDNPTIEHEPDGKRQTIATCAFDKNFTLTLTADDKGLTYEILLNQIPFTLSGINDTNQIDIDLIKNHLISMRRCDDYIELPGYVSNKNGGYQEIETPIFLQSFCESYTLYDTLDPDPPSESQLRDYRWGERASASFNCDDAPATIEKLICSNVHLAWIDKAMAGQFWRLKSLTQDDRAIIQEQKQWLSRRNVSCGISKNINFEALSHEERVPLVDCIKRTYLDRMKDLGDRHFKIWQRVRMESRPQAE